MATAATTEAVTARQSLSQASGRLEPGAAGAYIGDLFAEHGRMVLGLSRLLLRDPVEAEDATQQVFLSAHEAVLRGSLPRDPPAWIAAITRNECRARARARMREPLSLPELPSDLPDPLATAIRAADLQAVWSALGALPRRQRRAFVLRELGGLSYHELGRALGVSQSAVESLLFRARQQVRSLVLGANAAAAPIAVRDQLTQLIPGFDPGSVGIVARIAAVPVAWKLAGAAVSVGVVASGAGGLHPSAQPGPAAHSRSQPKIAPARHVVVPTAPVQAHRTVIVERAHHQRHRDLEHGENRQKRTEPREAVEPVEPDEHAAEQASEGPGPAPAEAAQVEQSHDGTGGEVAGTGESGHDGRDGSSGSDGGSDHSGPG
jgi:RNA polymerase sigma factor (sigma-70 family)